MARTVDPYLTGPDLVVSKNLLQDLQALATPAGQDPADDDKDIKHLLAVNDPKSPDFVPTVFTTWDDKDLNPTINKYLVKPYTKIAMGIVRHPTDVVFLTHIILYLTVNLASAAYLYYDFHWYHGVVHTVYTVWCAGAFTLLMHNHIHNGGVLKKEYAWFDLSFPYLLEPLMGHTWDSYYYHHVKHHHVEGNGPDDLSSTIRYQRDSPFDFACYVGRFLLFVWAELPLYFLRKGKSRLALQSCVSEMANYAFFYFMAAKVNFSASMFVLLLPFGIMRIGLMVGNWGQHALVDEVDPDSDFRSSITLIDVPSNRFCFNDGYHTAHHLNPRRHWRDAPVHFLQSKEAYSSGRALVFHNIDYLMLTVRVLKKQYLYLAENCLIPIGDQTKMSKQELADMLRTKTKAFTEEDIRQKFGIKARSGRKSGWQSWMEKVVGGLSGSVSAPMVKEATE